MNNDSKNELLITNIQRFSLNDGPGIRTTVFFKGCSICCPWCSNPENIIMQPQNFVKDGQKGVYGYFISCEELFDEIIKDEVYYENNNNDYHISTIEELNNLPGGVTFSGGEALLQVKKLVPLFKRLKKEKIHMAVETSLYLPLESLELAAEYIDLFYIDVKLMDYTKARDIIKGKLDVFLDNLKFVFDNSIPVVFRVPVIAGYTDSDENCKAVVDLIKEYKDKVIKVELLQGHNLGYAKYKSLEDAGYNLNIPDFYEVSSFFMKDYKKIISDVLGENRIELCQI